MKYEGAFAWSEGLGPFCGFDDDYDLWLTAGDMTAYCWRRTETTSWTDHVRNQVLRRVKEDGNIQHTIKKRKANWICRILGRNCLLKYVIEEKKGKDISDGKTRNTT
jgi:hypothetical protein